LLQLLEGQLTREMGAGEDGAELLAREDFLQLGE
jgi:hypothetical protein